MIGAYYNEFDAYVAAWLGSLCAAGEITPGRVDSRSIADVSPDDLAGFRRAHFFAGIGGWDEALRLAGWPAEREAWTGSCPCQPFSAAGKRGGFDDARHLWPVWFPLIDARRPATVFGEQVASPDGLRWLDAVCDDLESIGYTVRAADLPAASVGAPHIRQRLWWRADRVADPMPAGRPEGRPVAGDGSPAGGRAVGSMADAKRGAAERHGHEMARAPGSYQGGAEERQRVRDDARNGGEGHRPNPLHGFWRDADWLGGRDGKWRPVEPGTFPLADGIPGRVGRLRAYGNAIVPQVAAAFIVATGVPMEPVA